MTCGVLQGSFVAPKLSFFINDVSNASSICEFMLYADDTNLFVSSAYNMNILLYYVILYLYYYIIIIILLLCEFMLYADDTNLFANMKIMIFNIDIVELDI